MDKTSKKTASNSGSKFVIVGIGNTILDFGLMNIFSIFIPAAFANFLSTGIAMISSFYFNKKWTFSSTARSKKRFNPPNNHVFSVYNGWNLAHSNTSHVANFKHFQPRFSAFFIRDFWA